MIKLHQVFLPTCFLLWTLLPLGLLAQTGIIKGKVSDKVSNEPIPFANILVLGTDFGATTDDNGLYEITGLSPGLYSLRISFVGYEDASAFEIQVSNNKPAIVDLALESSSQKLEEVVIKAPPFKKTEESPVSLRTIGVAEIQRNPGGNRDISKVVQTLPGVTITPAFRNDLIIRGGAPNENRFFLDDVEVPNINHFATQGASGGPVGLINVNFINEVDFFSGAFPANRGNAVSSVFNFRQRDGRDDRIGGTFMVSASDIGLTLEGPIGEKTTFLVSARRSYLQFLFRLFELPFLPIYNDFQAKVKIRLDKKNELTFIGLGAYDQFELNLEANDTEEQQSILDRLPETPQWNYTNGLVYKHYRPNGYYTVVLSRNMLDNQAIKYFRNDRSRPDNLILDYQSQEIENKLRIENTVRAGEFRLNYGIGYEFVRYNNRTFNRIFTSSGSETVNYRSAFNMQKYSFFGQVSRKFLDSRLSVSAGLRADANSYSEAMSNPLEQLSPRLSASYNLSKNIAINFNTGIFYQLPPFTILGYQQGGEFINKNNGIRFIRNNQMVAGLELNTNSNARITIEGFYKGYSNYPFLLRDSLTLANLGGDFGVVGNEPAVPSAEGRSYGLEFLFQQRLFKGFYGIAAYTLGRSEFEDKNGIFLPSSWDARHIVNLTLGKKLKKDWEIGLNWRFQSGLPRTPFSENSSLVANWNVNGRGIPDYERLNTERSGPINFLDFRVDKKWFFPKWSLNLYFDIENMFSASVPTPELFLDRPLDAEGRPIGSGEILNPSAPTAQQRYKTKVLDNGTGQALPSIGLMIEW
jgi:hypothetical protein